MTLRLDPRDCPTCHGEALYDEDGTVDPCYDEHHQATAADPVKRERLAVRIRRRMIAQRIADGARHSEARRGAAELRRRAAAAIQP